MKNNTKPWITVASYGMIAQVQEYPEFAFWSLIEQILTRYVVRDTKQYLDLSSDWKGNHSTIMERFRWEVLQRNEWQMLDEMDQTVLCINLN